MQAGDRVGRYVVEALLGEGGMGAVYRAWDEVLRRRVALKLVRPDAAGSDSSAQSQPSVRRVLREARAAAALDHANVVSIFDFGEHEGAPFIVMELVPGRPLRAFVGAAVPPEERVRWLADVARALAAAHRVGLVHRDIKPENVIVRDDGAIKVLDFGIARQTRSAAGDGSRRLLETTAGESHGPFAATEERSTVAGTPAYMAPEQIRGEEVDARADQFAWGVLAYEVLSGRQPWEGPPTSLMTRILAQAAAPLDAARLGVDARVVEIVQRAMRKDRAERFASMDEVVAGLGGRVEAAPPSAPVSSSAIESAPTVLAGSQSTSGATPHAATSRKRKTRVVVAAGAAGLGVLAIAALVGARAMRSPAAAPASSRSVAAPEFDLRDPRRVTFDEGCEEFPSFTADGRALVFDATSGADSHVVVLDLATKQRRSITNDPGWQFAASMSPDGRTVAYLAQHGADVGTWLVPFDGGAAPRLVARGQVAPTWTPAGDAIWAGGDATATRFDAATLAPGATLSAPPGDDITRVLELRDGRRLARLFRRDAASADRIVLYDRGAGEPSAIVSGDALVEEVLTPIPGERGVLFTKVLSTGRRETWRWPFAGAAEPLPLRGVDATKGLAFSPAGDRVAWSTCATETSIAALRPSPDGRSLEASPLFPKAEWSDLEPASVPGGSSLVVISDRGGPSRAWVIDASGHDPARAIDTGDLEPSEPAVSPDGRSLVFAAKGRGLQVVPLDGSAPPRALTFGKGDAAPSFSRDGARVFYEADDGGSPAVLAIALAQGARPERLVEHAMRPSASPRDDVVAYLAGDAHSSSEPRLLDLRTGRSSPLSPSLGVGHHAHARFSSDGRRVAVENGLTQLVEIDVASRAIVRRFDSTDQIVDVAYQGDRLVIATFAWRGDLWLADVATR